MLAFNPITYFNRVANLPDSDSEAETQEQEPVEYIIRTRSQKATAAAAAAAAVVQEQSQQEVQEQSQEQQSQQSQSQSQQEQEHQTPDSSDSDSSDSEAEAEPKTPFKSIIRTRSQKLAENRAFMVKMFADINEFYWANNREPLASSSSEDERNMASFLTSLRDANAQGTLGGQSSIDKVHEHLPWFNFEVQSQRQATCCRSRGRSMVVRLHVNIIDIFFLCMYLSLMVTAVNLMERCVHNRCPSWVLDAGDAVTSAENYLRFSFARLIQSWRNV